MHGLASWDADLDTGNWTVDAAFWTWLGFTPDDPRPTSIGPMWRLVHRHDRASIRLAIESHVVDRDRPVDRTLRVLDAAGVWQWLRLKGEIVAWSSDGSPARVIGTVSPAAGRAGSGRPLSRNEWYFDLETHHVTLSMELCEVFGFPASFEPRSMDDHEDLFDHESWRLLGSAVARARRSRGTFEVEVRLQRDGRDPSWLLVRGEAVRTDAGSAIGIHGIAMDITALKLTESDLVDRVSRDPLTGLLNRAGLVEEIGHALEDLCAGEALTACLLVDLDGFKAVNDAFGHAIGDRLLVEAALRLRSQARAGDGVARLGGDEFVVLLRGLAVKEVALEVADRILEALRAPFLIDGSTILVSASIGVALAAVEEDADSLLSSADRAMYAAKSAGRDRIDVSTAALLQRSSDELELVSRLRTAVEQDELEIWFQPEVELATGRIVAGEALLRWRHPSGSATPAGDLIRVFEDSGLIRQVGVEMLRRSCEAAASWQSSGTVGLRVNTSFVQLAEPAFLEVLDVVLGDSGLDPRLLTLEFTETVLLRETATVRRNLAGIANRGIRIGIDGYGSGHSSLSHLQHSSIDVIVLDRSLIANAYLRVRGRRFLEGVIRLGRIMHIDVIAGGLEVLDQAQLVLGMGCIRGQGQHFSAPVPGEEFQRSLLQRYPPIGAMLRNGSVTSDDVLRPVRPVVRQG